MHTLIVIAERGDHWQVNLVDVAGELRRVHSRRRFPTASRALGHVVRLMRRGLLPASPSADADQRPDFSNLETYRAR